MHGDLQAGRIILEPESLPRLAILPVYYLGRYRVVRRPFFKSGAAVHVEHADPRGQCISWSMPFCVASAALGAC